MHNKFTKRVLCVASLFALNLGLNAQNTLLFTEVCVANIDQTIDYSNNYGGWVELYNPTATSVSLDGWYISDDSEILTKHRLLGYGMLKSDVISAFSLIITLPMVNMVPMRQSKSDSN